MTEPEEVEPTYQPEPYQPEPYQPEPYIPLPSDHPAAAYYAYPGSQEQAVNAHDYTAYTPSSPRSPIPPKSYESTATVISPILAGFRSYRGRCKWFNSGKGFGFIIGADGEELFVHHSAIHAVEWRSLAPNEEVEFNISLGRDGRKRAVDVCGPGGAVVHGGPSHARRLPPLAAQPYRRGVRSYSISHPPRTYA